MGERKDSQTYVRNKKKACDEVGITSFGTDLPESASEEEVLQVGGGGCAAKAVGAASRRGDCARTWGGSSGVLRARCAGVPTPISRTPCACAQAVAAYNANPDVHGILVQLPLPKHISEQRVLDAISIEKDVDGFHPLNIGCLAMRGRQPLFVPCTPKGCLELLKRSGVQMSGKKAAVVGRSNIVGMPAALLLQREDATVTVVHSRTPDAESICADADIIIAACGRAEMVKGDWIKPGAVVIDVGINAVDVSRGASSGQVFPPSKDIAVTTRRCLARATMPCRTLPQSVVTAWWATSRLMRPASAPPSSPQCQVAWAP